MLTEEGKKRMEMRKAKEKALSEDVPVAMELCRMIRDDPNARYYDRLYAVALLEKIKGKSEQSYFG